MKLKICKAKDTIKSTKKQPEEWEKILTNSTSYRGLISKIYNELKKLDINTPNTPIKNGVQILTENSQERNPKWQRHFKKCSIS